MFYLELHVQGRKPSVAALVGERWSVGRRADNDFVVPDPYASGYHGVVTRRGNGLHYQDVGSRHGSFVRRGGEWVRIEGAQRLDDGELVLVGRTRLRFVKRPERLESAASNLETMPGMMTAIGIDGGEMLSNATGMDPRMLRDLFALAVGLNRAEDVDAVFRQVCLSVWARMTDVVGVQLHLSGPEAERVMAMGRRVQTPPPRVPEPVRVFAESSGQMIVYHPDDVAGDVSERDARPEQRPLLVAPLSVAGRTLGTLSVATVSPGCRPGAAHQRALAMIAELASASLDRLAVQAQTGLLVETLALLPVRAVERFTGADGGYCERVADMADRLMFVVHQSDRPDWERLALPRSEGARLRVSALLYSLHVVCADAAPGDVTRPGTDPADGMGAPDERSGLLDEVVWPLSVSEMVDAARLALALGASRHAVDDAGTHSRSIEAMAMLLVMARACTPRLFAPGREAATQPEQAVYKLVQSGQLPSVALEVVVEMFGSARSPITSNVSMLTTPMWGEDTPMPKPTWGIPGRMAMDSDQFGIVRPARSTRNHGVPFED